MATTPRPHEDDPGSGALSGVVQLTLAVVLLFVPINLAGELSTSDVASAATSPETQENCP